MEEKRWDLKSEISELNLVPEFSFVLREEGEEKSTIVDFPDGKLKDLWDLAVKALISLSCKKKEAQRKAKVAIDRVMRGEVKPIEEEVIRAALAA